MISCGDPYTNLDSFKMNIVRMLQWPPWGTGAGQTGSAKHSPSIRHLLGVGTDHGTTGGSGLVGSVTREGGAVESWTNPAAVFLGQGLMVLGS